MTNGICWTDTTCQTTSLVSTVAALPGFAISVVPNPMQEQAVVLVQSPGVSGAFTLELYDVRGQHLRSMNGKVNERMVVLRGGLATGMYFFRVRQDGTELGAGRIFLQPE
jgi:hypothetical protein